MTEPGVSTICRSAARAACRTRRACSRARSSPPDCPRCARGSSRCASRRTSSSAATPSVDLERLEELAQDVLGESEGVDAVRRLRRYRELQELDLPIVVLVGGGTGTGKSRVATEIAYRLGNHARHVHRLHPADDARLLLGGVHAVDPLLELRGRPGGAGGGRPDAGRVPRPDAERPRRRARRHRAGAPGGLVDGARGRPSRARACCRRSRARSPCSACSRSRARTSTPATSGCGTRPPRACGRWGATSSSWTRSGACSSSSSTGRDRCDVPVIENSNIDATIGEVMDLVLASAERLGAVGSGLERC